MWPTVKRKKKKKHRIRSRLTVDMHIRVIRKRFLNKYYKYGKEKTNKMNEKQTLSTDDWNL